MTILISSLPPSSHTTQSHTNQSSTAPPNTSRPPSSAHIQTSVLLPRLPPKSNRTRPLKSQQNERKAIELIESICSMGSTTPLGEDVTSLLLTMTFMPLSISHCTIGLIKSSHRNCSDWAFELLDDDGSPSAQATGSEVRNGVIDCMEIGERFIRKQIWS